jgi:hypothetical protein
MTRPDGKFRHNKLHHRHRHRHRRIMVALHGIGISIT